MYIGMDKSLYLILILTRQEQHLCYFLLLYLHLGQWGRLRQFGIYKAEEEEEEEEEAHRAKEQRQDLKEKVRPFLLQG